MPEHLEIVLIHRLVARTRGVSQAASHLRVQPDDVDRLGEGVRPPGAMREEELHGRPQDGFLSFDSGDRFWHDPAPFEKLNEANALDVFRRKPLVALRTDELE